MRGIEYHHFLIGKLRYLTVFRAAAGFQGEFAVSLRLNNGRLKNISVGEQDLVADFGADPYRDGGQKHYDYARNDDNQTKSFLDGKVFQLTHL